MVAPGRCDLSHIRQTRANQDTGPTERTWIPVCAGMSRVCRPSRRACTRDARARDNPSLSRPLPEAQRHRGRPETPS
jgi:hypothetical protein